MMLLAAAALAGCPASVSGLSQELDRVDAAWIADDGVEAAWAEVRTDAGCAAEVLPPELVARLHTAQAMAAILAKDPEGALAAVRGSRDAAPDWRPADAVAPVGSSLRGLFDAELPEAELLPLPTSGRVWWVDGARKAVPTAARGRAVYLQAQDTAGRVVESRYLPVLRDKLDLPQVRRPQATAFWVGGAAALLAGVGGLVAAGVTREAYLAEPVGSPRLSTLDAENLGFGVGGAVLAAAGSGLLVAGAIKVAF